MAKVKRYSVLSALLVAALTLLTSPLNGQVNEDYIYEIQSVDETNKCIDIQGASQSNEALAQIYPCHNGMNQRWKFVSNGSGRYRMMALHSRKCLDVKGADQGSGRNVQQYTCHGGANQLWEVIPYGTNVEFKVQHSDKCLDASNGDFSGPLPWNPFRRKDILEQDDCDHQDRQQWILAVKAICGNDICERIQGENLVDCPADCAPTCGNSLCEYGESYETCPDCAPSPTLCETDCTGRACTEHSDCADPGCPQGWCDLTGTCDCPQI